MFFPGRGPVKLLGNSLLFRNMDREYGSRAGLAFHLDIAAVLPNNFVAAGQAKARSPAALAADESLGEVRHDLLGNTYARVGDPYGTSLVRADACHGHAPLVVLAGLDGVYH